ncbi:MAG: aspartate aminotransferase family protein, partial [Halobacterium sp.]
ERVDAIQQYCYEHGVLVWTAGQYSNVLRLLPPLVLTERQAEVGTEIIADAIAATADHAHAQQ